MKLAPAIALVALLGTAPARADVALERCRAAARELKSGGRTIDGMRDMTVVRAREIALESFDLARSAESRTGEPRVVLPWLERLRSQLDKDDTARNVAERLHFAAERLSVSCDALAAPPATAAQVDRERLVAILSRPEYELHARDEQFLARLLTRAWTWLRDVFVQSEAVQKGAVSLRAAFLIATALAATYAAWRLSRVRLARRRRASSVDLGGVVLDDPARYHAGARQALQKGEAREAIRLGMLTLLATLERMRLCAPGRAATNREIAEHVERRGAPLELSRPLRDLIGWYDRAWYGLAVVDEAEARRFVESANGLAEKASQTRAAGAA